MSMRLLLVEDERTLSAPLARGLREEGHQVDVCESGMDALDQARQLTYDVILLDWMLPGLDGLAVLRAWRRDGLRTPVLMLTARDATAEKVLGLRTGADDYLVKPFAFDELLARIEALHRRTGGDATSASAADVLLDIRRRALRRGDAEITLTAREFGVAAALFEHPGEVLTRSELLARVWGPDFDGEPNVVDVYLSYLRRKLTALNTERVRIATVRGLGWRLEIDR
jgi:two-component system, OmpR family, response regulator